jgi:hypothetical protein
MPLGKATLPPGAKVSSLFSITDDLPLNQTIPYRDDLLSAMWNRIYEGVTAEVMAQIPARVNLASTKLAEQARYVLTGPRSGLYYQNFRGEWRQASAPGQPPTEKNSVFMFSWLPDGKVLEIGTGRVMAEAAITSPVMAADGEQPLAAYLEEGTGKMAPRPFIELIRKRAWPKVMGVFNRSFLTSNADLSRSKRRGSDRNYGLRLGSTRTGTTSRQSLAERLSG